MKPLAVGWLFLAASLCTVLGLPPSPLTSSPGRAASEGPRAKKTTEELIRELGSDQFDRREAATRELKDRKEAIPALRQALKSADPEVARLAALILPELVRREARRLADDGEVDQVVERLVRQAERPEGEIYWNVVAELAWKMVEPQKQRFGGTHLSHPTGKMPLQDITRYRSTMRPQVLTPGQELGERQMAYVIRGEEVTIDKTIGRSLIVSSGRVRTPSTPSDPRGVLIASSVIFANDSIEVQAIHTSVVVCGGDFTAREHMYNCVVVARGSVRCPNGVRNCVVATSGSVQVKKPGSPLEKVAPFLPSCLFKENEPTPLGWVQFFDPARVGVTVESVEGGVQVKEVHEKKPFAMAGLPTGDLITGVGGSEAKSPESFRRFLRRAWACEDEVRLTVRRAGKDLDLFIPCQE